MTSSTCRLCGKENNSEIVIAQGIFRCDNCGCIYRSEDIDYSFYLQCDYWYKGEEVLKLYQKSIFAWFEDYILPGNSIEFGAADGDFISILRDRIDSIHVVYNELIDMLRREYKAKDIDIVVCPLEEFPETRKYNNVFMINMLEHLNKPLDSLEQLKRILDNKGRIFIVTDDGDSINAHNEMLYYREHTCILGRKGIDYICDKLRINIVRYFVSPLGQIFVILEKYSEERK